MRRLFDRPSLPQALAVAAVIGVLLAVINRLAAATGHPWVRVAGFALDAVLLALAFRTLGRAPQRWRK